MSWFYYPDEPNSMYRMITSGNGKPITHKKAQNNRLLIFALLVSY